MSFEWTQHALESLRKRAILPEWVDEAFHRPQLVEPDRVDADLEHRLARIAAYDGRVLRVIVNTARTPPRIVTAYFDRGMRNRL